MDMSVESVSDHFEGGHVTPSHFRGQRNIKNYFCIEKSFPVVFRHGNTDMSVSLRSRGVMRSKKHRNYGKSSCSDVWNPHFIQSAWRKCSSSSVARKKSVFFQETVPSDRRAARLYNNDQSLQFTLMLLSIAKKTEMAS